VTPLVRLEVPATPVGPVTLVASDAGLLQVRFGRIREGIPGGLPGGRDATVLVSAAVALEAYFQGARDPFSHLPLDLRGHTDFRLEVLELLRTIPRGEFRSYGQLCRQLGRGSPRALGQAVGANPLPLVIPCHRVVAGDLRLGGFSGGLSRKVRLLEFEGVQVEGAAFHARIRVPETVTTSDG
jgi:methylated-DNA-[protein]-cysteine S-methyltransferase